MKIKYAIMLACLAVAFAAASAWVFLSRGKSARAVRTKFRLGGLMLTVTSLLAVASCDSSGAGPGKIMCYDPAPPTIVDFSTSHNAKVTVGDEIAFQLLGIQYSSYRYNMTGTDGKSFQEGEITVTDKSGVVTVGETDYRGPFTLCIYGVSDGDEISLGGIELILK